MAAAVGLEVAVPVFALELDDGLFELDLADEPELLDLTERFEDEEVADEEGDFILDLADEVDEPEEKLVVLDFLDDEVVLELVVVDIATTLDGTGRPAAFDVELVAVAGLLLEALVDVSAEVLAAAIEYTCTAILPPHVSVELPMHLYCAHRECDIGEADV